MGSQKAKNIQCHHRKSGKPHECKSKCLQLLSALNTEEQRQKYCAALCLKIKCFLSSTEHCNVHIPLEVIIINVKHE